MTLRDSKRLNPKDPVRREFLDRSQNLLSKNLAVIDYRRSFQGIWFRLIRADRNEAISGAHDGAKAAKHMNLTKNSFGKNGLEH